MSPSPARPVECGVFARGAAGEVIEEALGVAVVELAEGIEVVSRRPQQLGVVSRLRGHAHIRSIATGLSLVTYKFPEGDLEARIDRLALEGEDAEDAFVDPVERLGTGESLQGLDAEAELAKGK